MNLPTHVTTSLDPRFSSEYKQHTQTALNTLGLGALT